MNYVRIKVSDLKDQRGCPLTKRGLPHLWVKFYVSATDLTYIAIHEGREGGRNVFEWYVYDGERRQWRATHVLFDNNWPLNEVPARATALFKASDG